MRLVTPEDEQFCRNVAGDRATDDYLRAVDYAEASYFDGYHYQHVAEYHEQQRLARIDRLSRRILRGR